VCIAIIKPSGIPLPSEDTLHLSFCANSHGAGLSTISEDGGFMISKGYFDFDEYYSALKQYVSTDNLAFLHMRIATHGNVDKGNCHPFPVCDDYGLMRYDEIDNADMVFMHNGMLSIDTDSKEVSDTMTFNKMLYMGGVNPFNHRAKMLIEEIIDGSRIAFMKMDTNGKPIYRKYGEGWIKNNGVWYSNYSFCSPLYPTPTSTKVTYGGYGFSNYAFEVEDLLPDEVECVAWGECPSTMQTLDSNHVCKSAKLDYSNVVKWLNRASADELRLSGLSQQFIVEWQKVQKSRQCLPNVKGVNNGSVSV
jgi:hypothetical protein